MKIKQLKVYVYVTQNRYMFFFYIIIISTYRVIRYQLIYLAHIVIAKCDNLILFDLTTFCMIIVQYLYKNNFTINYKY